MTSLFLLRRILVTLVFCIGEDMICKLSDIVNTANTGADAIKKAPILNEPTNLRCLRIGDVSQKRDFSMWGYTKTSKMDYERYKLHKGDSIIARTGNTIGVCTYIEDDIESVYNNGLIRLTAKKELARERFLFYLIRSTACQDYIQSIAYGTSTQPNMKIKDFLNFDIIVPTLEIQDKIIAIVDKIEKKIQVNTEINNNLLEQALNLYATQFSSLELNGCIGDYCSVKSGFAFKSSWWTNSGIRVIKIGSINQDNLNLLECSYVDEDKADKAKDFVVKAGDLLIAMTGATIGKFAMIPYSSEMLLVNQRVGKFFLGNNPVEKLPFIYCTLKQPEVYGEVVNRGQGSAQPNISASDIMSIPCVIPSKDAINDFNNTSQPLFDLIISNQRENQHLSELRNVLLPKLMSGELDVSKIKI